MISRVKSAAAARWCERAEKSSSWPRSSFQRPAMISALMPWPTRPSG
jgi:hypothetical protein